MNCPALNYVNSSSAAKLTGEVVQVALILMGTETKLCVVISTCILNV